MHSLAGKFPVKNGPNSYYCIRIFFDFLNNLVENVLNVEAYSVKSDLRQIHVVFFIRTKFIRTQAFGHPEIKNMVRKNKGFPQQ